MSRSSKKNRKSADRKKSIQRKKSAGSKDKKIKSSEKRSEISKKKTPAWFYLVMVFIPFLFFILLELGLRTFDYGTNLSQWVKVGSQNLMINPDIGKRYFTATDFLPKTSDDDFGQVKGRNEFRVFVLGGSSAAGFPFMPLGSFSSYVKRRLELNYPGSKIEVVNISMTAINSYTLLDLIPGVLDQNPDLILIYAGHNEYYGALGVGSIESLGSSRNLIKSLLYLNKFKITQLFKDFLGWTFSLFSAEQRTGEAGTLMSRMVEEKSIPFNSQIFNDGTEQFELNMTEILELIREAEVPVVLGRLISNYKDQPPFVSVKEKEERSAEEIYLAAKTELEHSNFLTADSLFRLAKDLDALRFRAPEKINQIISELGIKKNVPIADIDSIFNIASPDGITGNKLMVDHLHPNVEGYMLMGKAYYEKMTKHNFLPKNQKAKFAFELQDSVTREKFVFTELDSAIGNDLVTFLKNDWPFQPKKSELSNFQLLKPKNYIDSISLKYINNELSFVDSYLEAATISLRRDNIKEYLAYMNTLIYKYPGLKDISTAVKYFYNQRKITPKDYTNKRLGIISILTEDYDDAINYLNDSNKENSDDSEILYYLALAYYQKEDFERAMVYINKCLGSDDPHSECRMLLDKIKRLKTSRNL